MPVVTRGQTKASLKSAENNSSILYVVLSILLIATVVASLFFVPADKVSVMAHDFIAWVHTQGFKGILALIIVHATAVSICFPATILFEWGAGFIFGVAKGVAIVSVSKAIGGLIGFTLGQTLLRGWVVKHIRNNPRWSFIYDQIGQDGLKFAFLLRLSPVPSWVNNYGLSITGLSYVHFSIATLFGSLPFIVNNVWMGSVVESLTEAGKGGSSTVRTMFMVLGLISTSVITTKMVQYARTAMPQDKKSKKNL